MVRPEGGHSRAFQMRVLGRPGMKKGKEGRAGVGTENGTEAEARAGVGRENGMRAEGHASAGRGEGTVGEWRAGHADAGGGPGGKGTPADARGAGREKDTLDHYDRECV
jgi:hypothetical protein